MSRPEGVHPRQRTPVPVTSRRRDGLPDRQSCGQVAGGLLPVRKQGEDLSPRAGRRTQVRAVAAPGWQSVPADRGSADDERLPRSSLAAWTAPCPPEPWMTSPCELTAAGASGQEPGRKARSAGTGSLCAGRGCFPGCSLLLWQKDGQRLQDWFPAPRRTGPERRS